MSLISFKLHSLHIYYKPTCLKVQDMGGTIFKLCPEMDKNVIVYKGVGHIGL